MPEAEKALGIKINFETVNANDLQPRITSAIQSGAGPDMIMLNNNHPQLYAESLVDVATSSSRSARPRAATMRSSKVELARRQQMAVGAVDDRRRHDRLPQVVVRRGRRDQVPEDLGRISRGRQEAEGKGRPLGQTLGHTFGDAPAFSYPFLWSLGGKEVEADGKTVAINSKETIESVKYMTALLEGRASTRAASPGTTRTTTAPSCPARSAATLNGASIYIESLRKPDQYKTDNGKQLKTDILHAPLPKGPAGSSLSTPSTRMHADLFEEPEGGQGLPAVDAHQGEVREVVRVAAGLRHAADRRVGKAQGVGGGSGDAAVQGRRRVGRTVGYRRAGRTRKAAEVLSKYIVTDMYAKAIQGMAPEDAVKWARGRAEEDLRLSDAQRSRGCSGRRVNARSGIEWSRRFRRAAARPRT